MSKACPACGAAAQTSLETWKQTWWQCERCGTLARESRVRTGGPLLRTALAVVSRLAPGKAQVARRLLTSTTRGPMSDRAEVSRYFYGAPYEGSEWQRSDDQLLSRLAELEVPLTGQRVLSISDGPGFLAQRLKPSAAVVTTEVSQVAVDLMREQLGIDARVFDFDGPRLASVAPGPFDCILLRACVDFCRDLGALARDLRDVLAPEGRVYVVFRAPSRAACLQTMFEDFAPNRWSPPEVFVRTFEQAGLASQVPLERYRETLEPRRTAPVLAAVQRYYSVRAALKAFTTQTELTQYACLFKRVGG